MFKNAKVVMLPTKKASENGLLFSMLSKRLFKAYRKMHGNKIFEIDNFGKEYHDLIPHEIYIVTDDEITDSDWVIDLLSKEVRQIFEKDMISVSHVNRYHKDIYKKIIATTDESIGITDYSVSPVRNFIKLPKPSDSFIKKFIEEYNKGKELVNITVEYEEWNWNPIDAEYAEILYRVKVHSSENTITIRKIKKSWNREEMEQIVKVLHFRFKATKEECDKWISDCLDTDFLNLNNDIYA